MAAATGAMFCNGSVQPTSTRLTLHATTSKTFRKYGEKESVVVTLASPADSNRAVYASVDRNVDKQHMIHVLKSAAPGPIETDHTLVLDSMEKGVAYPAVHLRFGTAHKSAVNGSSSSSRTKDRTLENGFNFQGVNFDRDLNLHQGLYIEVDRIEENVCLISKPPPEAKAYLMVGFKSIKGTAERMLEESWKEWTGARYLYLNAADEYCLSTIRFFQRIGPEQAVDMFQYIVIAEFENVNQNNSLRMLDFVHRLRQKSMKAFTSLYRPYGISEQQHAVASSPVMKNGASSYWPKFDSSYDSQDSGRSSTIDSPRGYSGSLRGSFDDDLHRFGDP